MAWAVLEGGGMHAVSFNLKRGHLCAVAFGRRVFGGTKPPGDPAWDGVRDMTPARFDILYLLHEQAGPGFRDLWNPYAFMLGQREIRATLGLAGATVSKMVKRLVELGLVTSERNCGGDARRVAVGLTREGIRRVRQAMFLVFTKRALERHFERYAATRMPVSRSARRRPQIQRNLDALVWGSLSLAEFLHDTSTMAGFYMRYFEDH